MWAYLTLSGRQGEEMKKNEDLRATSGSSDGGFIRSATGRRIGRRSFIKRGSVSLAGAGLASVFGGHDANGQSARQTRLAMVKHDGATDEQGTGLPDVVKRMVDTAIRELTGKDSLRDAWCEFVSPDDVVGLKINLRGGRRLSTQPCVVNPILDGLVEAGVKRNNIIVYDAENREFRRAGYTLNDSEDGVRYYGVDRGIRRPRDRQAARAALKPFYLSEPVMVADKAVYFSKILAEEITALINVPLIKDHRLSGVTVSMKNHFGSILNPSDLHNSCCDPYLAELNAAAPIKDKTRLIIVDGLRALYDGGPRDNPPCRWRQNSIIAGTDTVAVDHAGLQIIEAKRKENGVAPLGDRARHVATAAKIGLGTNDPAQIDIREIDLTPSA